MQVFIINICFINIAKTYDELKETYVTRSEWEEWSTDFSTNFSGLENATNQKLYNEIRYEYWLRDLKDETDPLVYDKQLEQYKMKRQATIDGNANSIFSVTFVTNGGLWKSAKQPLMYRKGSDETLLPTNIDIYCNGKVFVGWYDNINFDGSISTSISSGTNKPTIYFAKWRNLNPGESEEDYSGQYKINYFLNGGSWHNFSPILYRKALTDVTLPDSNQVQLKGYNFLGWYETSNFSTPVVTSIPASCDTDKMFYAKWQEATYNVAYHYDGTISDFSLINSHLYHEAVPLPTSAHVTRSDYLFIGWYKNSAYTGAKFTSIPAYTTGDFDFYLKWVKEKYNISFNTNGGSFVSEYTAPSEREYLSSFTLPTTDNIKYTGRKFAGWYDNPSFSGTPVVVIPANTEGDKVFYAKWDLIKYTISYDTGGHATAPASTTKTYNQNISLPNPTGIVSGYVFCGWYTDTSYATKYEGTTELSTTDGSSITLYAMWKAKVTFNKNGYGTTPAAVEVDIDSVITLPNMASITGCECKGWYKESSCINKVGDCGDDYTVTAPIVLYVKWEVLMFTMNYHLDHGSTTASLPTSRKYFDSVTLPNNDKMKPDAGYKFRGWFADASHTTLITSVAANSDTTDVYAYFEPMNNWSSINYSSWMSKIPDDMYLSEINIPGSHDSGCKKVEAQGIITSIIPSWTDDFAKTQSYYVVGSDTQLEQGVRALDIRLDNNDRLCHGDEHVEKTFAFITADLNMKYLCKDSSNNNITLDNVFDKASNFLNSHPTETIIMRITNESGSGDPENARATAEACISKYSSGYSGRSNYKGVYSGTTIPKLGDVRGKIVILSDGIGLSNCISYNNIDSDGTYFNGVSIVFEDHYNVTKSKKWDYVLTALNKCTTKINTQINKSSKTSKSANIWTTSNRADSVDLDNTPTKVDDYMDSRRRDYGWVQGNAYGIIWMDFVRQEDTKPIITSNP